MIDAFLASYGLKALKYGSPVLSILEAAAESDLRNSQDIFSLLRATTLEQAAGTALDRLAADEGLTRQTNTFASGAVNITDSSFTKISSSVYQGLPAPIAGVNTINIVDGSGFTATGSVYIGRGTNNYEGPLAYTAVTQNGVYWYLTLSGVTANYHNIGESVILAQGGNRQVTAGEVVQTPQGNASTSTQFKVLYIANIPDGETEIDGVQVVALLPGLGGNVQYNTVTQFTSAPFNGATVTNPLPFSNALAAETDDQLRERIREARATRAQGTVLALTTGVIGAVSPDENKTITSASFVGPTNGAAATLYVDDGTGYEEIYTGVPYEQVVAQAQGGEQYFQIASDPPVTKARLVSTVVAPFNVAPGSILAVLVGGVLYEHSFNADDFQNPTAAAVFEVVASINADAALAYQALASNNATTVTIVAKADNNESLQIASDRLDGDQLDANPSFGFPVGLTETMVLYRNDRLLNKDGQSASVESRPVSTWGYLSPVETLILQVDGTASPTQVPLSIGTGTGSKTSFTATAVQVPIQANTVVILVNGNPVGADNGAGTLVGSALASGSTVNYTTGVIVVNFVTAPAAAAAVSAFYVTVANGPVPVYTITAQSFINANTGFSSVGINSMAAWAAVLNATIPGITAVPSGSTLTLTSNLGPNPRAQVVISGGTLLGKLFNLENVQGLNNDYTLNRNTGQISLLTPLSTGDTLSIGSAYTRAFLQSPDIAATNITGSANFFFIADGDAQLVPTGVNAGTQLTYSVSALENWGARVRLASTLASPIFTNVTTGDQLVMWDPGLSASNRGRWHIDNVDPLGTWVEIGRQSLPMAGVGSTATLLADGINVLIVGGWRPLYNDFVSEVVLYNSSTGAVTVVGSLNTPRAFHTATLLPSGAVLVAGGLVNSGSAITLASNQVNAVTNTCEIYSVGPQTWAYTGALPVAVAGHKAVLLDAGGGTLANQVLIAGGLTSVGITPVYTTNTASFSGSTWTAQTPLLQARGYHQMTYITGSPGYVLVSGGTTAVTSSFLSECETLDVSSLVWSTTGSLNTGRYGHKVTILPDGTIAATGGYSAFNAFHGYTATKVVETFNGSTWNNSAIPNTAVPHAFHAAVALGTSGSPQLLLSGGVAVPTNVTAPTQHAELLSANVWTVIPDALYPNSFNTAAVGINATTAFLAMGANASVFINASSTSNQLVIASAETFSTSSSTWTAVTDATLGVQTITNSGVVVVNSSRPVQQVAVPAATNVLAPTLAQALNAQLEGASAIVYQTNELRVNTNTYDPSGSIALVSADLQAQQFGLPTGSATVNLPSHVAEVQSGSSDLGTPNFQTLSITSVFSSDIIQVTTANSSQNGNQQLSSGNTLVGLKDFYDENLSGNVQTVVPRFGSNLDFVSPVYSQTFPTGNSYTVLTLRDNVPVEWLPEDRVYAAHYLSLSPEDTLTVVLDNNATDLRFIIPMYRRLQSPTSAYGTTNTFRDLDNLMGGNPASLAYAFGITPGFNFDDFAVYMHARTITNPSSTTAVLWRYYRFGPEGNLAQIRYDYPTSANANVGVTVDFYGQSIAGSAAAQNTNVSVTLPSGALLSGAKFRPSTRVGLGAVYASVPGPITSLNLVAVAFNLQVASADRGVTLAGHDTLTLTLPPGGFTDHGLQIGNAIYLQSSDINFASRVYVITGRTPTTIQFADSGATYGPVSNIGEVSFDSGDANIASVSGLGVGTVFTLTSASNPTNSPGGVPSAFDVTMGVNFFDTTGIIEGYVEDLAVIQPNGVLGWYTVGNVGAFEFYNINTGANTVTQIAGAVNALAAVTNSMVPVTAAALPGSTGSITQSTTDATTIARTYYPLTDGINFVQSYTAPGSTSGDYTVTFKDPVNSALAAATWGWQYDEVRIVPTNMATLSLWLNSNAITGLANNANVQTSANGHRLVIASDTPGSAGAVQVQGGSANFVSAPVQNYGQQIAEVTPPGFGNFLVCSIDAADDTGLVGSTFCALQNTVSMPRTLPINASTVLQSIDSLGNFVVSGTQVSPLRAASNTVWQVEAQGEFVAYAWAAVGTKPALSTVQEGDYAYVTITDISASEGLPLMSGVNCGLFRIVRVDALGGVFWVENPNFLATTGWADVKFLQNDGLLPGDTITISTPVWGAANMGTWTVHSVGVIVGNPNTDQFLSRFTFQVVSTQAQPITAYTPATPTALGSNSPLIQVLEGSPSRLIKNLIGIAPNQEDGTLLDLKFDTAQGYAKVGIAAGTLVQPLDKLDFSTGIVFGIDAYSHSVGLIGEANKIVYGDTQDTATYPGIAAAGASINIAGPFIHRIIIGLVIQVDTSTAVDTDVQEAVQSAVASYVNSLPTGVAVDLGAVIAVVEAVYGVTGAAITSPSYGPSSLKINIQPFERARVLNLSDIGVSFANQ